MSVFVKCLRVKRNLTVFLVGFLFVSSSCWSMQQPFPEEGIIQGENGTFTISKLNSEIVHSNMDWNAARLVFDKRSKGYGGVQPYVVDKDNKAYLLLSREAGKTNYCDFGGKVDFKNDEKRYGTLIGTAARELLEESAEGIRLSTNGAGTQYITNNSICYYDLTNNKAKLMCLTKLSENYYVSSDKLLEGRNKALLANAEWKYLEKDDFVWVSLSSLADAIQTKQTRAVSVQILPRDLKNPCSLNTNDIKTQPLTIDIRPCYMDSLIKYKQTPIVKDNLVSDVISNFKKLDIEKFITEKNVSNTFSICRNVYKSPLSDEDLVKHLIFDNGYTGSTKWEDLKKENKEKIIHQVTSKYKVDDIAKFITEKNVSDTFSICRNVYKSPLSDEDLVKHLIFDNGYTGSTKWEDLKKENKEKIIHQVTSKYKVDDIAKFITEKNVSDTFSICRNVHKSPLSDEDLVKHLIFDNGYTGSTKGEDLSNKSKEKLIRLVNPHERKLTAMFGDALLDSLLDKKNRQRTVLSGIYTPERYEMHSGVRAMDDVNFVICDVGYD